MNYDIETALEDALITVLKERCEIDVIRWEDTRETHLNKELTDVIKVSATLNNEEEGTYNLYVSSTLSVNIAAFSSKRRDIGGRNAAKYRGIIRSVIAQDDIVTLINAIGTLLVYNNGIIATSSFDASDNKINSKGITITVIATQK